MPQRTKQSNTTVVDQIAQYGVARVLSILRLA